MFSGAVSRRRAQPTRRPGSCRTGFCLACGRPERSVASSGRAARVLAAFGWEGRETIWVGSPSGTTRHTRCLGTLMTAWVFLPDGNAQGTHIAEATIAEATNHATQAVQIPRKETSVSGRARGDPPRRSPLSFRRRRGRHQQAACLHRRGGKLLRTHRRPPPGERLL